MVPHADAATLMHGGDLGAARRLFPGAPEPFIDLSTGINPHPYPIAQLSPDVFSRLPEAAAVERLAALAAQSYGAPSPAHVVAAPGTQILLPQVAGLVARGRAAVLGPTYAEHARVVALVGHAVTEVADVGPLANADLAIVVNPNNPDGRILDQDALLDVADNLRRRDRLLVVDETFMDVSPDGASLAHEVARGNVVVLRSFGKFFGLAGVRLGFALAAPQIAVRLSSLLGPWAVSGPAIAVGAAALADHAWQQATRARLADEAAKLDVLLSNAGLQIVGGTPLFRLVHSLAAAGLFEHLGRSGIFVRRFPDHPTWLRFGLPANPSQWQRLEAALRTAR